VAFRLVSAHAFPLHTQKTHNHVSANVVDGDNLFFNVSKRASWSLLPVMLVMLML
jgi:hypothetical protein